MHIDRQLNLVLPITRGDGPSLFLYSTPLSRMVFEANFRLIARAEAEIYGSGRAFWAHSGPRVAALTLRDVGKREALDHGIEDGDSGAGALLAEIKRLTSVVAPSANGWETTLVDSAILQSRLSADEWAEAENTIAFFMLVSAMEKRSVLGETLTRIASFMGAVIESRSLTEFADSLPTLRADDSPPNPTPSLVPR